MSTPDSAPELPAVPVPEPTCARCGSTEALHAGQYSGWPGYHAFVAAPVPPEGGAAATNVNKLRRLAEWILRQEKAVDAIPPSSSIKEFGNAMRGLQQLRSDFAHECSPSVILALLDRVEEAGKDTARLDWLASQPLTHEPSGLQMTIGDGNALRHAIDSARLSTPENPGEPSALFNPITVEAP